MFNLKPKEEKFYILFFQAAQNVHQAAMILRKSMESLSNKDENIIKIQELEHKGDKLASIIIKELNEAFITPIDREDIYTLVKEVDDILDLINSTMHRFMMFNIERSTDESKLLADMIVNCTNHICEAADGLSLRSSKSKYLKEKIKIIKEIENEADKLFRKTVTELFKKEANPFEIIKWKEIYQILENTIDRCEKIANTVEGVVIKNA